jgi:Cu/Ag efflux protein CusF
MRVATAASLIAVALAFTLPVQAQDKAPMAKPKKQQLTGVIESIDAKANTVTVKAKEASKVFKVGKDTKYGTADKKTAMLSDLKVGDKVTVAYTEEGMDLMASKIAPPIDKKNVDKKD